MAHARRLMLPALALLSAPAAYAQDVTAAAPHDLSVTIYRDPYRDEGGFELDELGGFAFITETRRVVIPAGEHSLRFEGVADGIEPASALITGLPSGVIEKNRDAALLSPDALVQSTQAQNGRVILNRTNPATGVTTQTDGVIRSAADGVIVETADGVEALRCSGLPETFGFESTGAGLSAKPTLSVLTRTDKPVEAVVQLSYLARGFDWAADYIANMSGAPGELGLGAWVTLVNGNGVSFNDARVQVVAGRLNRDTDEIEPIVLGQPILAYCWPQDTTSNLPPPVTIQQAYPLGFEPNDYTNFAPGLSYGRDMVVVTAQKREETVQDIAVAVTAITMEEAESLGDLLLYRVPGTATVASRQSKQVRLLDREDIPVTRLYGIGLDANENLAFEPMTIGLRMQNDKKSNLGIPLPSGRVAVFETAGEGSEARRLLSGETGMRDITLDEEIELWLSESPDVQVRQTIETRELTDRSLPILPDTLDKDRVRALRQVARIEITNARPFPILAEIDLQLWDNQQLVKADHPTARKNGRPLFRVTVPANDSVEIRYQTTTE